MAKYYDAANTFVKTFNDTDVTSLVYCKLFGDVVTETVCSLRRQFLTSKRGFSCKACIMNIALGRRLC